MKTKLLFAALLMCAQITFAQFYVGVHAGANVSTLQPQNIPLIPYLSYKATPNVNTGLSAKYEWNRYFYLFGDLTYSGKGAAVTAIDPITDYDRVRLHNLEASIMPALHVLPFLNLEVGGYFSYLLAGHHRQPNGNLIKVTEQYQPIDYGYSFGLSFERNGVHLGLRYQQGLKEWTDWAANRVRNQNFQFWVAYLYPCNKR